MEQAKDRLDVLERIAIFEKIKSFNTDVELDAPAKEIRPKDVDYTNKKWRNKILSRFANKMGAMFFESMIKKKKFIIKEVDGIENAQNVPGGAIVTCNHFNMKDNYAVYKALKPTFKRKQRLYKIIKDSNYTNFKGIVRLLMHRANTLPLSKNMDTMKKFYKSVGTLLDRGEKILIYPEQSMWWNYKKPRPLMPGAFKLAAKNNVPVLPIFITMKDSDILDNDGFFVQEYYIHILPAIYPNQNLSDAENVNSMREQNYDKWVNVYENFYGTKLAY